MSDVFFVFLLSLLLNNIARIMEFVSRMHYFWGEFGLFTVSRKWVCVWRCVQRRVEWVQIIVSKGQRHLSTYNFRGNVQRLQIDDIQLTESERLLRL